LTIRKHAQDTAPSQLCTSVSEMRVLPVMQAQTSQVFHYTQLELETKPGQGCRGGLHLTGGGGGDQRFTSSVTGRVEKMSDGVHDYGTYAQQLLRIRATIAV
jgi:hypothetical protein